MPQSETFEKCFFSWGMVCVSDSLSVCYITPRKQLKNVHIRQTASRKIAVNFQRIKGCLYNRKKEKYRYLIFILTMHVHFLCRNSLRSKSQRGSLNSIQILSVIIGTFLQIILIKYLLNCYKFNQKLFYLSISYLQRLKRSGKFQFPKFSKKIFFMGKIQFQQKTYKKSERTLTFFANPVQLSTHQERKQQIWA